MARLPPHTPSSRRRRARGVGNHLIQPSAGHAEAERLSATGVVFAQQGHWAEAAGWFAQALARQPDYAEAHSHMGAVLHRMGRLNDAVVHLQQALARQPDFAHARYNLASVLAQQGLWLDAERHYERARQLTPQNPLPPFGLALAAAAQGRPVDAAAFYRQALSLQPDFFEAHNNLGNLLEKQGDHAAAVPHYRRAVALRPDSAEVRVNLGLALAAQDQLVEARAEGETAARLPDYPSFPHFSLGVLFARCGLGDRARVHFESYLRRDPADRQGAHMMLAMLGAEPMPPRAPDALMQTIYGGRAESWDHAAASENAYRGAGVVSDALHAAADPSIRLDILDAGCGTGLVGALVHDRAAGLDGVDVSAAMLDRARHKQIYRTLHHGDLVDFMRERPRAYDAVTAAATLIHFGDLRPVFDAAAVTLRERGLLVFTVFPGQNAGAPEIHPDMALANAGCYAHCRNYVAQSAQAAGFSVELLEDRVHEFNRGDPRIGLLVVLRRND